MVVPKCHPVYDFVNCYQTAQFCFIHIYCRQNKDFFSCFSSYFCPKCEYPMCNESCSLGPTHSIECEILSRCKSADRPTNLRIDKDNFNRETNAYAIITPLRLLLLEESNNDNWKRSNQLMDHYSGMLPTIS